MDFNFNDSYSEFISLGTMPFDVMELVYVRSWPVIYSAWTESSFNIKSAILCVKCIAKSFKDWPRLRQAQAAAGVPRLTEIGYWTLIKNSKNKLGWQDMPRFLFFGALDEIKKGGEDPSRFLWTVVRIAENKQKKEHEQIPAGAVSVL